jgi:dihydrolipoamide dehydrogenase
LRNAEIANLLTRGKEFGFSFENLKLDYGVAHKRSREVSVGRVKGVQFLMKKNKIDVYQGVGKLKDATHIEITAVADAPLVAGNAFTGMIESKNTVIATGARARSIPGVEVDGEAIITYRHALEMTQAPKSMVIIGAGPIGLEFGYVFRSYGAEVTIIEMLPNAAPLEDEEVAGFEQLRKQVSNPDRKWNH